MGYCMVWLGSVSHGRRGGAWHVWVSYVVASSVQVRNGRLGKAS